MRACRAQLPHLILNHETGVLVTTSSELGTAELARDLASCERSFRSLWLFVVLDDAVQSATLHSHDSLWPAASKLLAAMCTSPLKITVRSVAWAARRR